MTIEVSKSLEEFGRTLRKVRCYIDLATEEAKGGRYMLAKRRFSLAQNNISRFSKNAKDEKYQPFIIFLWDTISEAKQKINEEIGGRIRV